MTTVRNREEYWTGRTARKRHVCEGEKPGCPGGVEPGQRYVEMKLPPNSDLGNQGWWRMRVCRSCAEAYNKPLADEALAPNPTGGR